MGCVGPSWRLIRGGPQRLGGLVVDQAAIDLVEALRTITGTDRDGVDGPAWCSGTRTMWHEAVPVMNCLTKPPAPDVSWAAAPGAVVRREPQREGKEQNANRRLCSDGPCAAKVLRRARSHRLADRARGADPHRRALRDRGGDPRPATGGPPRRPADPQRAVVH